MHRVLYLVTFKIRESNHDAFLEAARDQLKPYWEAHGVERFEVYDEVGPTGPTGRVTQAYWFATREAYLAMQSHSDPAMPTAPYRWLFEPEYRVLDLVVPAPADGERRGDRTTGTSSPAASGAAPGSRA